MRFGLLFSCGALLCAAAAAQTTDHSKAYETMQGLRIRQASVDDLLIVSMPRPGMFDRSEPISTWHVDVGPEPRKVTFQAAQGDALFVAAECRIVPEGAERCPGVQMELLDSNGRELGTASGPLVIEVMAAGSGEYSVRIADTGCRPGGCRAALMASKVLPRQ